MFKTKIPLFYLVLATFCGSLLGITIYKAAVQEQFPVAVAAANPAPATQNNVSCHFNISRLSGYKYIHPVYSAEPECEANIFLPLKNGISEFIENMKTTGDLNTASVYLKDMTSDDWTEVNPGDQYRPGSLIKINTMITYLRMAETNPGILNKEITYTARNGVPVQTFNSKTITPGHTYKISELIKNMIVYSDNNATMLLHSDINVEMFQKTFTDLGLKKPDVHDAKYALSVKDYSRFMSVLYDGAYLTIPASEYAISLLSESDFKLGIVRELPSSIKVAHKFGEAGTEQEHELHECAIVYLSNKPYLITIMTKGKDVKKLAR